MAIQGRRSGGLLANPSNGVGSRKHFGAEFGVEQGRMTNNVKSDDVKSVAINTSYQQARLFGVFPVTKISGATDYSGFGNVGSALERKMNADEDYKSDWDFSQTKFSAFGSVGFQNWTVGLRYKMTTYKSEFNYSDSNG